MATTMQNTAIIAKIASAALLDDVGVFGGARERAIESVTTKPMKNNSGRMKRAVFDGRPR
jgi:hypothetical protein